MPWLGKRDTVPASMLCLLSDTVSAKSFMTDGCKRDGDEDEDHETCDQELGRRHKGKG